MNKLLRNTVIISSLWVLTLVIGLVYIYGFQKRSLSQVEQEQLKKSSRLTELNALKNDLSELENYYYDLRQISLRYRGTLASFVSPGETFDYIRRELKTINSSIKLNMEFMTEGSFQKMVKRTYELRGTGKFIDIYKLLWFLENGPVFYSLNTISIDKVANTNRLDNQTLGVDETSFQVSMFGFDRKEGPKITELNRDFGQPKAIANLFNDRFSPKPVKQEPVKTQYAAATRQAPRTQPEAKPQPENPDALPEITSNCEVLAVTPFSVMVRDAKGRVLKLRKGDKIFGGALSNVNAQTGEAVFTYNPAFGSKTIVLSLKK
ncbi:MAG TPA: hypothetical protein ENN22_08265 [bacterium]|nr:hypothetical protein [bacterium]